MPNLTERDEPEIEITEKMLEAGAEALAESSLSDPLREIAERVFAAMFYTRDLASSTMERT
jgi:hypothetical protein